MKTERVEVSVVLPRNLWEELQDRAQVEHEDEMALLIRAIEQFLQQQPTSPTLYERLAQECAELAALTFDDIGNEDEWLVVQNEALATTEAALR